jgi:hypothetical protein
MVSFLYSRGDIAAEKAKAYLVTLAGDFLDRAAFDWLPLDLIVADKRLKEAYLLEDKALPDPQDYARLFRERIEEDGEKEHPDYRAMKLLEIVEPRVPEDALAKVRRRFRLLDRGPARARE